MAKRRTAPLRFRCPQDDGSEMHTAVDVRQPMLLPGKDGTHVLVCLGSMRCTCGAEMAAARPGVKGYWDL